MKSTLTFIHFKKNVVRVQVKATASETSWKQSCTVIHRQTSSIQKAMNSITFPLFCSFSHYSSFFPSHFIRHFSSHLFHSILCTQFVSFWLSFHQNGTPTREMEKWEKKVFSKYVWQRMSSIKQTKRLDPFQIALRWNTPYTLLFAGLLATYRQHGDIFVYVQHLAEHIFSA